VRAGGGHGFEALDEVVVPRVVLCCGRQGCVGSHGDVLGVFIVWFSGRCGRGRARRRGGQGDDVLRRVREPVRGRRLHLAVFQPPETGY
jgi:hypothetical protein